MTGLRSESWVIGPCTRQICRDVSVSLVLCHRGPVDTHRPYHKSMSRPPALTVLVSKVKIFDLRTLISSCVSSTTYPAGNLPARSDFRPVDMRYHRIYINAVVARKVGRVGPGGDRPQETLIFQPFRGGCPQKIAGHTSRSSSSKNAFALD